jgi:threonine aldolase
MPDPIDLRSDTVTKPTAAMRQAMAEAEVGDAVIDIDPTVERLEQKTAEILGQESAVFVPSGSMANQIAVRLHCDRGSEFICEADCHIYHYEQGAYAQLSGLVANLVAGQGGAIRVEQLADLIHPENEHCLRTRLLCLENTHNRWGGRIQPQDEVLRVCQWAGENGLKRHLDGARLWNAAAATGKTERELAAPFDSVSVCFSKGLGAPVGSALAGTADFVYEARRVRKLFGGGMRQAGIIAAGAIHAVDHHRQRLQIDHQHARQLGQAVEQCEALRIRGGCIDTNMVIFEIDPRHSTAAQFQAELEARGVRCFDVDPQAIRLVTHLDVDGQQIQRACDIIRQVASLSIAESV